MKNQAMYLCMALSLFFQLVSYADEIRTEGGNPVEVEGKIPPRIRVDEHKSEKHLPSYREKTIYNCEQTKFRVYEEPKLRSYSFTVSPLGLGSVEVEGAYRLAKRFALVAGLTGYYAGISIGAPIDTVGRGGAAFVGGKIFLSDDAFTSGWHLKPVARLGYAHFGIGTTSLYHAFGSVGGVVGYGWVFDSGFTANLGLGADWIVRYATTADASVTSLMHGLWPSIEASIGYSW